MQIILKTAAEIQADQIFPLQTSSWSGRGHSAGGTLPFAAELLFSTIFVSQQKHSPSSAHSNNNFPPHIIPALAYIVIQSSQGVFFRFVLCFMPQALEESAVGSFFSLFLWRPWICKNIQLDVTVLFPNTAHVSVLLCVPRWMLLSPGLFIPTVANALFGENRRESHLASVIDGKLETTCYGRPLVAIVLLHGSPQRFPREWKSTWKASPTSLIQQKLKWGLI